MNNSPLEARQGEERARDWEQEETARVPITAGYVVMMEEVRAQGREEGRAELARLLILRLGEKRFGSANLAVRLLLEMLPVRRLEKLALRLLDVESWDELLAE
jgi:hypothetical protein